MKNGELFGFRRGLEAVGTVKGSAKVVYALVVNLRRVRTITDDLEQLRKPSPAFQEYERKRLDLVHEHATKDEAGQTVLGADGRSATILDRTLFDAAIVPLKEEYADAIETQAEGERRFAEILEEEAEFVPKPTVDYDAVAKLDLTVAELDGIFPVIWESEDEDDAVALPVLVDSAS